MGTLKTTNIQSISGSGTVTLGVSGETFNVPSGVTISNSGTATGFGGANTPAFLATNGSTDQSISDQTVTKVNFGSEVYDTDSAFSSSKFTVPSGANGKYMIYASVTYENTTGDVKSDSVRFYKNGSSVLSMEFNGNGNANMRQRSCYYSGSFDLSASDYIEIYFVCDSASNAGSDILGSSSSNFTYFGGYKLII